MGQGENSKAADRPDQTAQENLKVIEKKANSSTFIASVSLSPSPESGQAAMDERRQLSLTVIPQQAEQLKGRAWPLTGEVNFMPEEDLRLETTQARLSNLLKRHEELTERLSRDSDKLIFERLQKEFEAARAAQTEEIYLDGEQWNDGLLATIRERVHMEADRKAMPGQKNMPLDLHLSGKPTYKVGNKLCVVNKLEVSDWNLLSPTIESPKSVFLVICCLEGARIGIQYETSFAGESCGIYHCVLESKSFLEKMSVIEHTIPFFLPIREAENDLSSNAMKFIDYVGDILQAYVDRREQVRLIKELYGNQIVELYHSISYNWIEFALDDFDWYISVQLSLYFDVDCLDDLLASKVTISLRYVDLVSVLPTRIRVLAWPLHSSKRMATPSTTANRRPNAAQAVPSRLSYAEDALRTLSLPQAYAEIVLNLPRALQQTFPYLEKSPSEKSTGPAPL
ncbi:centromere protein O isoform X3 [Cinnamomum micranthum f. kanehirae]|uniref:Centromere protein O isoform X3 n=1 Tax=Cinnamomum micranthum f. kanehirae TaxID=337451 RepID=A0A443NVT9_9MAGN|nr:centromere protein O isoform X3 [Cinnamomum micranthum f. kanehirae]